MDANQRWGVEETIQWMSHLARFKPLWIEEPTSPDDVLGHATISKVSLKILSQLSHHNFATLASFTPGYFCLIIQPASWHCLGNLVLSPPFSNNLAGSLSLNKSSSSWCSLNHISQNYFMHLELSTTYIRSCLSTTLFKFYLKTYIMSQVFKD